MTQKQRLYFENQFMPIYSKGEEIFNLASHAFGAFIGLVILLVSMRTSIIKDLHAAEVISLVVYGFSAIVLYGVSAIYHGLNEGLIAKKIFRIIDHCTIYLLIAGTYTPICILSFYHTWQGSFMLAAEWICAIIGIVINALWLNNKYVKIISIFLYILIGGILYSFGVIFYGLGKRIKWSHSVFHVFCVLGSIVQFIGIYLMMI
ncbi:MAG: hemolysin III family protein [Bacilli bacterium]|nr:hemolysin III family protein [Bacilli bacterium]